MPTISGDVSTLLGEDHTAGDPVALWLLASQPILTDSGTGRTGGKIRIPVASNGTFSVAGLPATSGGFPTYQLQVDSLSLRRARQTQGYTTPSFPLTTDRDLTWIVDNYVPVTVVTTQVYADVQAAAALGATNDTATGSYLANPASATRAAGNAVYTRITQRPVNVLDYGADPTGVTDSSSAIRSALAASGRIEFGKGGTFLVSRDASNPWALSSPGNQVWSGQGATLKLANSTAPAVSIIRPLGNGLTVKDMVLDGNRANQSVETQKQRHGVFIDQADRITLSNVEMREMAGDGIMLWRSTDYITVRDCTVYNTDRNGMSLTGSGSRILISGLTAYGVAAQALDAECDTSGTYADVQVRDSYLAGAATDYAMDLTGLATAAATDWTITGNTFKGGIHLVYFQRASLINNTIDGTGANKDCLVVEYNATGLQVIGNTFVNASTRRGIAASYISGAEIDRMTIKDNEFYLATGAAVQANGVNRLRMVGNRASGTDTATGFAAFKAEATRDVRSTIIEDNEAWGFGRAAYTAGPNIHKYLRVANNYGHDDVAGGTYGTQLAGAASVYPDVTAYGNRAASGVTSAYSPPSGVWVKRNGGVVPIFEGTGTPESVLTSGIGSIAIRRDGGAATVLYIKETGSGNTGWVAK